MTVTNPRPDGMLRATLRLFWPVLAMTVTAAGITLVLVYDHHARDLPAVPSLADFSPALPTLFLGHDDRVLGRFADENRSLVRLDAIPLVVVQAFVAAEDSRFFEHSGVDLRAMGRAFLANLQAGRTTQGASTMTQQLAKTLVGREKTYTRKIREAILARRIESVLSKADILELYLNQIYLGQGAYGIKAAAQTYFGRQVGRLSLAEAAMLAGLPPRPGKLNPVRDPRTSRMRQNYVLNRMVALGFITKKQAQEAWAVPLSIRTKRPDFLGDNTPFYTEHVRKWVVETFGRDALRRGGLRIHMAVDADLQRAAQRGLRRGVEALARRQGWPGALGAVDSRKMEAFIDGLKSPEDPDTARLAVVTKVTREALTLRSASGAHQIPKARLEWAAPYDRRQRQNGRPLEGLATVFTVGDVVSGRLNGDDFELIPEPSIDGAVVAFEPHTDAVRVLVGGIDFDRSQWNRAFQGCRQPGSVFKPILYSLALERGWTLASLLSDSPLALWKKSAGFIWKPRNASRRFGGDVLLRDALVRSLNLPAVRLIQALGTEQVAAWAEHLGLSTPMYPNAALALGSSCVHPFELVQIFGSFPQRGRATTPVVVRRVQTVEGKVLYDRTHASDPWAPMALRLAAMDRRLKTEQPKLMTTETAFLMQTALEDVIRVGTGKDAQALGVPVAGKTGTTDAFDAWFVGYIDTLVGGVWIGNDRNRRPLGIGETGGKVALPVWLEMMGEALKTHTAGPLTEDPPPGISIVGVDRRTGLRARRGDPALRLPFKRGTEPSGRAVPADHRAMQNIERLESRF